MNAIKVQKSQLLAKLTANRTKHAELYADAIAGYRRKAIAVLNKNLIAAKAGKKFTTAINLSEPTNHTRQYDQAIAMLKMSIDEVIEITAEQFEEFVQDNWSWKRGFLASNLSYSGKIAKLAR